MLIFILSPNTKHKNETGRSTVYALAAFYREIQNCNFCIMCSNYRIHCHGALEYWTVHGHRFSCRVTDQTQQIAKIGGLQAYVKNMENENMEVKK